MVYIKKKGCLVCGSLYLLGPMFRVHVKLRSRRLIKEVFLYD